ncbi:MAG: ABC transporter permease [Bacillota bacterium]
MTSLLQHGLPICFEKRLAPSRSAVFIVPVLSVILALLTGGVALALSGKDPLAVYYIMFSRAFGSTYGLSETAVRAIPLLLAGLGVALAFRMQLWNIGGEGQLFMGAIAAGWVALSFPQAPAWVLLPAMFAAGGLAGGLWAFLPSIPRAYLGVNEIITTLMLNYVAILTLDYLVYGPWRDPGGYNFPLSAPFGAGAILPAFGDTRIHAGLLFGLIIAVIFYIVIYRSRWGYEIRVIGESPAAARYAGINIPRNIMLVMFVSGAICGLAGMAEVSGVIHRMQPGISAGYGYTAIIIAWLAKLNPFAIILVAFLFGGLQVGGFIAQTSGVPAAMVAMLQGSLLFFVLGGEILLKYRVRWRTRTVGGG